MSGAQGPRELPKGAGTHRGWRDEGWVSGSASHPSLGGQTCPLCGGPGIPGVTGIGLFFEHVLFTRRCRTLSSINSSAASQPHWYALLLFPFYR